MNAMTEFKFHTHAVRVQIDAAGLAWFSANDVCEALEMGNPRQAIESHVDPDDVQKMDVIDKIGRKQRANHVNESGLYALILGSTKDAAKRFKRWITSEVLPSIRRTGSYGHAAPAAPMPATLADLECLLDASFTITGREYLALTASRAPQPTKVKVWTHWTADEDRRLLDARANGQTAEAVARALGRSADSVRHRERLLKARSGGGV